MVFGINKLLSSNIEQHSTFYIWTFKKIKTFAKMKFFLIHSGSNRDILSRNSQMVRSGNLKKTDN